MEKRKVGRPRLVKTPNELMNLFLQYYEAEGKVDGKYRLLTKQGFMSYLFFEGIIKNIESYWKDLNPEFSSAKKRIEELMHAHWQQATANSDISTAYGIFYGKNAFKYSDKVETINTNLNSDKIEYTDEEISQMKKIALGDDD